MGRPLGSKKKRKCFSTLSHCLTAQVEVQDEEHLYRDPDPIANPNTTSN